MAHPASSVDNTAMLYHSWFPCRAEIFLTSGLVVMDEISMAARSLPTNLLLAAWGIFK